MATTEIRFDLSFERPKKKKPYKQKAIKQFQFLWKNYTSVELTSGWSNSPPSVEAFKTHLISFLSPQWF